MQPTDTTAAAATLPSSPPQVAAAVAPAQDAEPQRARFRAALKRRLEKLELAQLRDMVEALHERLATAEQQLYWAEQGCQMHEQMAESYRYQVEALEAGRDKPDIGMTVDGQVGIVARETDADLAPESLRGTIMTSRTDDGVALVAIGDDGRCCDLLLPDRKRKSIIAVLRSFDDPLFGRPIDAQDLPATGAVLLHESIDADGGQRFLGAELAVSQHAPDAAGAAVENIGGDVGKVHGGQHTAVETGGCAWFTHVHDAGWVISLCAGHAYLADAEWRPGTGALGDLGPAGGCCSCMGTATAEHMLNAPLRPVEVAQ